MTQKWAVTFGSQYAHVRHPFSPVIDARSYLVIEADDELEARHQVINLVSRAWAFIYPWDEFVPQIAQYGLIDVTPYLNPVGVAD
jgi:hypothetical protein